MTEVLAMVVALFAGIALVQCWLELGDNQPLRSLAWSIPGMAALAFLAWHISQVGGPQ